MKKITKTILALSMLFFAGRVAGQTMVASIISANETWTPSGNPYVISHNVLINSGVTVKVMPGTQIRSTGNYYRVIIDGTFIAEGTKDSVIQIDTSTFEFTKNATGYDFSTNSGSRFSYCLFNCNGIGGSKTIDLVGKSMFVSNCKFVNAYYTIYLYNSTKDTCKVRAEKSIFDGGSTGYGYPFYATGSNTEFEMDECEAFKQGGMILANRSYITRNWFHDWLMNNGDIRVYSGTMTNPSRTHFACNKFSKFKNTVLTIYALSDYNSITITENIFDSCGTFIECYPPGNLKKPNKILVEGNSFLYFTNYAVRFSSGGTPGRYDTLNFTRNYWGTTTTSKINAAIFDFNDDITVPVLADISNYLSSSISHCNTLNGRMEPNYNTSKVTVMTKHGVQIYPNPSHGFIQFDLPDAGQKTITIYSMAGQMLKQCSVSATSITLDLSALNNGIYLLGVESANNKTVLTRFCIQK